MVFLLILGGFPSQIKLNVILLIFSIKCFGTCRTEALKISLERPSVLTILIFPYNVSFLLCHVLSEVSYFGTEIEFICINLVMIKKNT